MHVRNQLFIGGTWVAPETDAVFEIVCPSTEEVVGRVPEGGPADMDRAVAAARRAFDGGEWSRCTPVERARVLAEISRRLGDRADELRR